MKKSCFFFDISTFVCAIANVNPQNLTKIWDQRIYELPEIIVRNGTENYSEIH